jgi:hypothetical protein
MTAGQYDLVIEQGATFQQVLYWSSNTSPPVPMNITGYTAKMQIRSVIGASTALMTLTTGSAGAGPVYNSGIILGTTNGQITIYITATDTLAISWVTGVYDLDLVSPTGFITRVVQGNVSVNQTATTI